MEDGWNICYNDDIQRRRRHNDEAMLIQEQQIHKEASSNLKLSRLKNCILCEDIS